MSSCCEHEFLNKKMTTTQVEGKYIFFLFSFVIFRDEKIWIMNRETGLKTGFATAFLTLIVTYVSFAAFLCYLYHKREERTNPPVERAVEGEGDAAEQSDRAGATASSAVPSGSSSSPKPTSEAVTMRVEEKGTADRVSLLARVKRFLTPKRHTAVETRVELTRSAMKFPTVRELNDEFDGLLARYEEEEAGSSYNRYECFKRARDDFLEEKQKEADTTYHEMCAAAFQLEQGGRLTGTEVDELKEKLHVLTEQNILEPARSLLNSRHMKSRDQEILETLGRSTTTARRRRKRELEKGEEEHIEMESYSGHTFRSAGGKNIVLTPAAVKGLEMMGTGELERQMTEFAKLKLDFGSRDSPQTSQMSTRDQQSFPTFGQSRAPWQQSTPSDSHPLASGQSQKEGVGHETRESGFLSGFETSTALEDNVLDEKAKATAADAVAALKQAETQS